MKDRNKILNDIVSNVLEIMPPNVETLKATVEFPEIMQILEVEITLKIRDIEQEKKQ